ncbi:MAG: diguanylate cyclase [Firmicutes bacterium]|nr:diguanylate cyclase [Bacillota bacterium]
MTKDLQQKLINTWDWLNSYCLSRRDDPTLACGNHAVCIIQIDDYSDRKRAWGPDNTKAYLKEMENIMSAYALEDTLIARYNDSTFVVVLHYLENYDEIKEICSEIIDTINDAGIGGDNPLTVSIGAAECHHEHEVSYECAMTEALKALAFAQSGSDEIVVAPKSAS